MVATALVDSTVHAALRFAAHRALVAGAIGSTVATLAQGVSRAMLMGKLKNAAAVVLAVGAIAVGITVFDRQDEAAGVPRAAAQAEKNEKPDGDASFQFQKVALGTDDLVEAAGLDIYKFQVGLAKGQRFRVVLQVLETKETPARVLSAHEFQKTGDGAAIIRVSFLRTDRKLQGFLLSNEAQAEYRLDCSECTPGGFATIVKNPLGDQVPTRRSLAINKSDKSNKRNGINETQLISLFASEVGRPGDPSAYPRAELVIVKSQ
jgi:hypothetical protein